MTNQTNEIARRFREEWFNFNSFLFFALLCLISVSLLVFKKAFIIDGLAAFEILNERGESGVINMIFGLQYLSVPVFYLWKITITTIFLWISSFFFGYRLLYKQLWKLILAMEIFFFVPELIKIGFYLGGTENLSYWDIKAFYPLSVLSALDYTEIAPRWHYVLKSLNVFEPIYWFLLYFGVYALSNKKRKTSFLIVLFGYIIPFFAWLGFYAIVYK